jgi:hypothetical protein
LQFEDPVGQKPKGLRRLRHREHRADILAVDDRVAEMLAVPGDVHLVQQLVDEPKVGFRPP